MENVNDVGNCGKELVVVAGTTKETSMAAAAWQRGERNDQRVEKVLKKVQDEDDCAYPYP